MQRTLKNLRVSLLCFLLTFLVLRNTIGAGKFGTPAQDFEEIRQHLHYVGLHRRHFRVLAEAVEEEEKHRETPMLTLERRSPLLKEEARQKNAAPLLVYNEKQGNALIVRHSNAPLLTSRPLEGGLLKGNAGYQKDLEGSRIKSWDEQRKIEEALAHSSYGDSRVLMVTGVQSYGCKNPAGEHFLLKSLKNKVDYSTLHGLEISLSFEGLDPEITKLSLLQRSLIKYPHVEWLWWVPNDALITNMAFKLPLQNYTDFNLVVLGSDDNAYHQQRLINLNTDTFLIRNCQWSLDLLHACTKMGSLQGGRAGRILTNSKGPHFETGDESALIYLLKAEKRDLAEKVYVELSTVLRGKWHDAAEKFERIVKQPQDVSGKGLPFVTHFLGCKFCKKLGDKVDEMCVKQAEMALVFAEKQSMKHSLN